MADRELSGQERMEAALKPFGWTMGVDFWRRYHSDPWVFNLANAVERQHARIELLERRLDEYMRRVG